MAAPKRHPLLLQREWMRPIPPVILSIAVVLILFWIAGLAGVFPDTLGVSGPARSPLIGLAAGIAFLAWVIARNLPRLAYVQCLPDYLLLRLGLLKLIISYSRLRTSRSVQHGQIHSPKSQPASRRALAVRMALKQCVAVELTSYPIAFFLLRALTHPFLFLGEEPGFLFAVEDWMGLGREVEGRHSELLARKRDAGKQPRLGAMS
ncbi:MAG: hypothetical protein JW748_00625 [Anaerolineales bacterium]|nr:hypothetical protein [Anaerolineales bacterium]